MAKQKLFIVHGWTYSLDKWEQITQELESRDVEPVLLRVPGLSEPSDEVWDVPKYVDWLEGQIGKEKEPILLGHSNGGRIGMAYDVAHPNHLHKLILLDSAGIPRDDAKMSWKRRVARPFAMMLKPLMPEKIRRKLYRLIGASDYGNAKPNMRETMKHLLEHDTHFDPSTVSAETSIIWGERDSATPLDHGYRLQQAIPNADELHIIHGAAHSPQGSHPEQVAQIVAKIVKGDS